MDRTRVASVGPLPAAAGWPRFITLSIVALVATGFFVTTALPYLLLDQAVMARYEPRRGWVFAHVLGGAVALLIGPVQVWLGISRRSLRLHRWLGLAYVTSVGLGSIAAFYLAARTSLGWVFGTGITGLGIAWVATTTMAVAAVRRGLIEQHQEWMIRSFVVTFAFVTFRVLVSVFQAGHIGTLREQLGTASWFCWAVPLLVTEIVLQGRRIFDRRHLGTATTAALLLMMSAPAFAQARLTGADLGGLVMDESRSAIARHPETGRARRFVALR